MAPQRHDEIDVIAIGRFLYRFRVLILSMTIVSGVLAGLAALVLTPIYRAEVVVTRVRNGTLGGTSQAASQLGGLAMLAGVNLGLANGVGDEAKAVLESKHLIELFIQQEGLLPQLMPDPAKQTLRSAVQRFHDSVLEIRDDTLKGITTIGVDWPDPSVAARLANSFVALANEVVRNRVLNDSKRNIDYLNHQIDQTTTVELKRVMYNLVESEMQNLTLANARTEYAFAVVDPAVAPERPVRPKILILISLGVLLGLVFGLLVALARRILTRRDA